MATIADQELTAATNTGGGSISAVAIWALVLFTLANALNYLDRQIVSILAQAIKADLQLDDAQLGFLLGTAFAVFYSVVGIAMGRVSDQLPRKKVMAFGLAFWSAMTALGGAATSFATLGAARIGVGVGEAVANPCGHSLVADIFPKKNRAFALSVLVAGVMIGTAGAMALGGWFLQNWQHVCGSIAYGPACALPGWKAALFAVGIPGLPLALLLLTVREPKRLRSSRNAAAILVTEIAAALPPFTFFVVHRHGGADALLRNLRTTAIIVALCAAAWAITGDTVQWVACGIGIYAVLTWAQVQSLNDRPFHALTFGDRTFQTAVAATALIGCLGGTVSLWAAPYAMRTFAISPAKIGLLLGLVHVAGGLIGVLAGGWITDKWRARDMRAPAGIGAIAVVGMVPAIVAMLLAGNVTQFFVAEFVVAVFTSCWSGATAAMVQDLVLPRMRGSAAGSYALIAIVISSGIGPYWAGKVSAMTGSLNAGLFSVLLLAPVALLLLWLTARRLPYQTPEARLGMAIAAGEPQ